MNLAPIVLFVFRRPELTKTVINALANSPLARETDLYIFSDQAASEDDRPRVESVREICRSVVGFKSVKITEREQNLGLSKNIMSGLAEVFQRHESVIVLEDDLIPHLDFLPYMNTALEKYKGHKDVFSISAFDHLENDQSTSYFLKMTSSWAWGTWKDRWTSFSLSDDLLATILARPTDWYSYNLDNSYDYTELARLQLTGKINSWAIYWHTHVFNHQGLTLFPGRNLVQNNGDDTLSTHGARTRSRLISKISTNIQFPESIEENSSVRKRVCLDLQNRSRLKTGPLSMIKKVLSPGQKTFIRRIIHTFQLMFTVKNVGKNSLIDPTVHVIGWRSVEIGDNTMISAGGWLNVNHRDRNTKQIIIGSNCFIGRDNLFSSAKLIRMSDYGFTGSDCRFLGSNHLMGNPFTPYISAGVTGESEIHIGANVWLGAGVTVIGHITIGHGSIIGAGSVVTKDIPPFSIAVGNPCKVIKRFDVQKKDWVEEKEFINEHLIPDENEFLKKLSAQHPSVDMPHVISSYKQGDLP